MKKFLKIAGILLAILIWGYVLLWGYVKLILQKDAEVTLSYLADHIFNKEECIKDFDEVHEIVVDVFPFFEEKGIDPKALYHKFSKRVQNINSIYDYYDVLEEYFASLQVGHASLLGIKNYTARSLAQLIEGELIVDLPSPYLLEQGLQKGDRIIEIDHRPSKEWLSLRERAISSSTDKNRRLMASREVFRSAKDSIRNYMLVRRADTLEYRITLPRFDNIASPQEENITVQILQDSIAYMSINSMQEDVLESFQKEYTRLQKKPYMIIDIRENGGGNSSIGVKICNYFVTHPHLHCLSHKQVLKPLKEGYKGKLFLLIGNFTFSAAESFALDMKEGTPAILVGEDTAGDTGNGPRSFATKRETFFRVPTRSLKYSAKGFPLEGKGISPHHYVQQTLSNYYEGKDTVLEYTLNLIHNPSLAQ